MAWKNWNYKIKGGLIGLILYIIIIGITYIFSPMLVLFVLLGPTELLTLPILGFFIGMIIDSIKKKGSATRIGFEFGLLFTAIIILFMLYSCRHSSPGYPILECFFKLNLIANFGYVWILGSLIICTLIGWIIKKVR